MVLGDPIGRQFLLAVILQLQLLTFSYADALRQFHILPAGMIFAKHYALKLQQETNQTYLKSYLACLWGIELSCVSGYLRTVQQMG
jgi:hypothetical protein